MMMINLEDLIAKFKAQRCYILGLNATPLTDEQKTSLREISRINHEIAQMLGLQVPSMRDLTRQAQEITLLEQMWSMDVNTNEKATTV
jgi:predicted nuclease with RNAse H fold